MRMNLIEMPERIGQLGQHGVPLLRSMQPT
jgi:hypothetical protein